MRRSPKLRQAYGPRQRRAYVDDAMRAPARFAPLHTTQRRAAPMPNGGRRWYAICPQCQQRRTRLYEAQWLPGLYRCRVCLGLKYRSQYQGRRVEASDKRLDWARDRLHTAEGQYEDQRWHRYEVAADRWDAKMARYHQARDLDFLGAIARMIGIIDREERRMERRRIYMWRYRRGWHTGDQLRLMPPARTTRGIHPEIRAALEAAQSA